MSHQELFYKALQVYANLITSRSLITCGLGDKVISEIRKEIEEAWAGWYKPDFKDLQNFVPLATNQKATVRQNEKKLAKDFSKFLEPLYKAAVTCLGSKDEGQLGYEISRFLQAIFYERYCTWFYHKRADDTQNPMSAPLPLGTIPPVNPEDGEKPCCENDTCTTECEKPAETAGAAGPTA